MSKKKKLRRKTGRRPNPNAPRKPKHGPRRRRPPTPRILKRLAIRGRLTALGLRGRMRAGGDLAPMTGVATFGPAGGTVLVTVAVSPATDRNDYGLYASSSSTSPSTTTTDIDSSASQPSNNLMEGTLDSYAVGSNLTIQLVFTRGTNQITLTATIPGSQVAAGQQATFTLS